MGKLHALKVKQEQLSKELESLKGLIVPGILFDELGFRYFGPVDGHNLKEVVSTLENIKDINRYYCMF